MKFLVFLLTVGTIFCQYSQPIQSEEMELGFSTSPTSSLLSGSKFNMSQGFTLMSSFGGNVSGTTGIFSNYMNYQINPNMKLHGNFHLVKPSYSINGQSFESDFNIQYDIGLDYRVSKNAFISFKFRNFGINTPSNQFQWSE